MGFFRRKLSIVPRVTIHSSIFILSTSFPTLLFSSAVRKPSSKSTFIFQYLVTLIGLSPEEAIKVSKQIAHIKTPSKPEAVLQFLKNIGLSDVNIRKAVSQKPNLLCTHVERTLKPKLRALHDLGFSKSEFARLVSCNPFFLHRKNVQQKIDFLMGFFDSKENLLKALSKSSRLLLSSPDKKILPNVSFLRACGLSIDQIKFLIKRNPRLITRKLDYIKDVIKRTEELGFVPGSGMFYTALNSTSHLGRASIDAKVKLLRSFGWSEAETSSAILKAPHVFFLSVTTIKKKVDFLVERAGCKHSYIAEHPMLLCCSLDMRLIPRNHVLQLLQSKGLPKRKCGMFSVMKLPDKKFADKFILPYQKELPDLHKVYLTALPANVPKKTNFP